MSEERRVVPPELITAMAANYIEPVPKETPRTASAPRRGRKKTDTDNRVARASVHRDKTTGCDGRKRQRSDVQRRRHSDSWVLSFS